MVPRTRCSKMVLPHGTSSSMSQNGILDNSKLYEAVNILLIHDSLLSFCAMNLTITLNIILSLHRIKNICEQRTPVVIIRFQKLWWYIRSRKKARSTSEPSGPHFLRASSTSTISRNAPSASHPPSKSTTISHCPRCNAPKPPCAAPLFPSNPIHIPQTLLLTPQSPPPLCDIPGTRTTKHCGARRRNNGSDERVLCE